MTLVWASGFNGITDPDAQAYLAAVESADGQAIEGDVALAISDFVVGCKLDGIWDAIKASCILAGARTLSGALVPLKGTAPTNYNFVAGDYNRKTGLVGDASTKYLRVENTYTANVFSRHGYIRCTEATSPGGSYNALLGGDSTDQGEILRNASSTSFIIRPWGGSSTLSLTDGVGGLGIARATSTEGVQFTTTFGVNTVTANFAAGSQTGMTIFARTPTGFESTDPRIAFFSGGQFLNLALLDARISTLMTDIGAAIP